MLRVRLSLIVIAHATSC